MKMSIRVLIAIGGVIVVLGALGAVKGLQIGRMTAYGNAAQPPPQTVIVATVDSAQWEKTLTAVGSLEAVRGTTIAAEHAGKVTRIAFKPGTTVAQGQLLLQQDVSEEQAQLRASESKARLARKQLDRASQLRSKKVLADSDFDDRQAEYDQLTAEVDNIRAIIEKKTIRAPFAGRLGIRLVNLGEVLESGQPIVSLQSLKRIFVNFQLPQQELGKLALGHMVRVSADAFDGRTVEGSITAINAVVDSATRNIMVQATVENPDEKMRPGMYVNLAVVLPDKRTVLTIPNTAVAHAPYGDSVFVVETQTEAADGNQHVLRQQFVELGTKRGDFVAVRNGLKAGQRVVSTGVFKLRNGQSVAVDNALKPDYELSPQPDNA